MLSFETLHEVNKSRCIEVFHPLEEWNPAEWSNAMAGEAGETCNKTKKLLRGEDIPLEDIGKEIADTIIYADLLATRLGINLEQAIINKFNKVSEERGSTFYL